MQLTEAEEAQVAALDINDHRGGLDYDAFRRLDGRIRDTFTVRQFAHARAVKAKQETAVAEWVKALTDDDILAILAAHGRPFDVRWYTAAIEKNAADACGLRYAAAPKNTAVRLEKLASAGKLCRLKGAETGRRWQPKHTGVAGFNDNQWVYFTDAVAAEFDELQRTGVEQEAERLARFRAAKDLLEQKRCWCDTKFDDHPRERGASVTVALEDFERLAQWSTGS